MAAPKKGRPANLTLEVSRPHSNTVIELETPVEYHPASDLDDELLQLSSPSSPSSPSSDSSESPIGYPAHLETDSDTTSDEFAKDLAALDRLRRSVQKNLRLRPLRSSSSSMQSASPSVAHTRQSSPYTAWSDASDRRSPSPSGSASPASVYFTPPSSSPASSNRHAGSTPLSCRTSVGSDRPLLVDTRPVASYMASRLERSINIAIPSLILKRCRKPNGGFSDLDALRQYITTEEGQHIWDDMMNSGDWDGEHNSMATAWALLPIVEPLLIMAGLFQLDVSSASRSRSLPQAEQAPVSPAPSCPPPSTPGMSLGIINTLTSALTDGFTRPPPPRRPSIPQLGKIDTSSAERLNAGMPRLQVRTQPVKAATLSAPPLHGFDTTSLRSRSRSPSHLNLSFSNHSPPGSARLLSSGLNGSFEHLPPPSPSLATVAAAHIVPARLCHRARRGAPLFGVKRILNLAFECDDDHGLLLRERFERYVRIPMRDTVEEDNITRGVREVCELLDDARLHSAPTYVHCKAGKSRSVTAVMAYLIHANHWTLSKAYAFVLERRKGISPNIGFVSELMTFEEQELGGKSVGVVKMTPTSAEVPSEEPAGTSARARTTRSRWASLPPLFSREQSFNVVPVPIAGDTAAIGDLGQEMEIKDASGRYRHARRAPPMRRVSKAGLESSAYA
ncbi:uncharacterized protein B0H18DRAFT_1095739 [Fomitopsis serialis]|uniref:uncharacterized protein n=1 Tax=Fomitopsis serialis TaxID=139415 RepID=UPI0020089418|nr:uncharacterized protein B0H18DRAFT_1095739 [Neoantrodia serialis]KAH9921108.1 hypothetical protein B0H18DRAFT_1095739 [Neoantrodia serialis]